MMDDRDDLAPAATDLEDVLRHRVPTRVRLAQVGVVLLVLAVLTGLLLHSILRHAHPAASERHCCLHAWPSGSIVLASNVEHGQRDTATACGFRVHRQLSRGSSAASTPSR